MSFFYNRMAPSRARTPSSNVGWRRLKHSTYEVLRRDSHRSFAQFAQKMPLRSCLREWQQSKVRPRGACQQESRNHRSVLAQTNVSISTKQNDAGYFSRISRHYGRIPQKSDENHRFCEMSARCTEIQKIQRIFNIEYSIFAR